MGTLLLHDPWVHFYLLYVAAVFVACIWDSLRNLPAIQDDSRTPWNEVVHGREVEARRTTARAQVERDRIQAYWAALLPERRAALEAEALAGAAPADRAAYAAAAPPVRRLLRAGLRDAHIRRLLGLPAAD